MGENQHLEMQAGHPMTPLTGYLNERAGAALRAVWWRTPTSHSVRYLRSDVPRAIANKRLKAFQKRLCESPNRTPTPVGLGGLTAVLDVWENAIILYLPRDENCGYIVSFDPEVGTNLTNFITGCRNQINSA